MFLNKSTGIQALHISFHPTRAGSSFVHVVTHISRDGHTSTTQSSTTYQILHGIRLPTGCVPVARPLPGPALPPPQKKGTKHTLTITYRDRKACTICHQATSKHAHAHSHDDTQIQTDPWPLNRALPIHGVQESVLLYLSSMASSD